MRQFEDGKTWHHHTNRDEYLKERALRYTLIYALDVSGYRSLLQLTHDITDERLLHDLHKFRAECIYIPPNACAESLKWLREKELEDRKAHNSQSRSKKMRLN